MKGGGILKSTITSILPIAGAIDGFRNFIDNNKTKTVETYIPTEQNINLEKSEKNKSSEENNSEKKNSDSDSDSDTNIDTDELLDTTDPYDELINDDDEDSVLEGGWDELLDF